MRMHRIPRNFLDFNRVITKCFLNPLGFHGKVFQSSTTTSEDDSTASIGIHTMNDMTPVLCVQFTHHVYKPQSLRNSRKPAYNSASPELRAMRGWTLHHAAMR